MDNSLGSLALTTGLVAATCGCVAFYVRRNSCAPVERPDQLKTAAQAIQKITPQQLASLVRSPDERVRQAAISALTHLASGDRYVLYFLSQCASTDYEQVLKAVTVINYLAQTPANKAALLQHGALTCLVSVIKDLSCGFKWDVFLTKMNQDMTLRTIIKTDISALQTLSTGEVFAVMSISNETDFIHRVLFNIMGSDDIQITLEFRRHAVSFVYMLTSLDIKSLLDMFYKWGIIRKTTRCLQHSLGDAMQSTYCLKILLYFIASYNQHEETMLNEMALHGILPTLFGLLRSEDDETLVRLTTVLIHEFCSSNIEKIAISKLPCFVKILFYVLNNTSSTVQHTILRILSYVALGNKRVQKMLLDCTPLLKKLSVCLSSGHPDVIHWSLVLTHDLAMGGNEAAEKMILKNPDIVKCLVALSRTKDNTTTRLIAETLGFICACDSLHHVITRNCVIEVVLKFAGSNDAEIQFWASALLLNLTMLSDEVKELMVRSGGVDVLLGLALSSDQNELSEVATNATKTLVILGFADMKMDISIQAGSESGILVDGTEYCPGRRGINMVQFDLTKFKFHSGQVVESEDINLVGRTMVYFNRIKKGGILFVATQGESCLGELGWEFFEEDIEYFDIDWSWKEASEHLSKPTWAMILMPGGYKVASSMEMDLTLKTKVNLGTLVSKIVELQLVSPLLDVVTSMPPASNISQLGELEIIAMLARHPFQRKVIVETSGTIEYLCELIWPITESQPFGDVFKSDSVLRLAHCLGALKLLHALSADLSSHRELLNRGMLRALVPLLFAICNFIVEKWQRRVSIDFSVGTKPIEEKQAWFDVVNDADELDDVLEIDVMGKDITDHNKINTALEELLEQENFPESSVDEHSKDEDSEEQISFDPKEVDFDEGDETAFEDPEDSFFGVLKTAPGGEDKEQKEAHSDSPVEIRSHAPFVAPAASPEDSSSPLVSDSAVALTDTQSARWLHRSASMAGLMDSPVAVPSHRDQDSVSSMSRRTRSMSGRESINRPHMRRLSRSMSVSLQKAKSAEQDLVSLLDSLDDSLVSLANFAVMASYHVLSGIHETESKSFVLEEVVGTHLISCISAAINCLQGQHQQRFGLAISATLHHLISLYSNASAQDDDTRTVRMKASHFQPVGGISSLVIGSCQLEVCNEHWPFETVLASQAVSKTMRPSCPLGWYYEVEVLTDGIIQIGWAKEDCVLDPAKGIGVGDGADSVGFDGSRCKIWNGPPGGGQAGHSYGIKWHCRDVVSVLLSKEGAVSFWLNGRDLGVAVEGIDITENWFPAVSLSVKQHCKFSFERKQMRCKLPAGYATIQEVSDSLQQLERDWISSKATVQREDAQVHGSHASDDQNQLHPVENSIQPDIHRKEADLEEEEESALASDVKAPILHGFGRDVSLVCLDGQLKRVGWSDSFTLLYYYEIDFPLRWPSSQDLYIGFIATSRSKNPVQSSRYSVVSDEKEASWGSSRLFYVSCNIKKSEVQPRASIGCGIIYPSRLFLVVDGNKMLFSEPLLYSEKNAGSGSLSQTFAEGPPTSNMVDVLQLLPYVSSSTESVNFGQSPFHFQEANKAKLKMKAARTICQVMSVEDRV